MTIGSGLKQRLFAATSATALALSLAGAANALPIRDDIGVDGAVDTDNTFAGVGMMWNRTPGGTFVCTGQLINPRTVVWAAHCADGIPQEAYGGNQLGGVPMGFGFQVDSLPGYFEWRDRGLDTGVWASNPDLSFYNVLQVQAPFALDGEFEFPGGDVSLATLDTPAVGLPTYGMLFSPITEDTPVEMVGYGGTGVGSGPNIGIDGKRRIGGNMLNGLFTQMDYLGATFGVPGLEGFFGPSGDQLLYHIDFDKPDREEENCLRGGVVPGDLLCAPNGDAINLFTWDGTQLLGASSDIDWYPGDAVANEAGTLGGDSGSGLFVNIGGQRLVTSVLSGGWVDGLAGPLGQNYADVSYYNPLFLFQNWIAEQNPYVYVSAASGDGNWSDPTRWTRAMDPNYYYVNDDGELVNGLWSEAPETVIDGLTADGPVFGTIFDTTVEGYRSGDLFDNPPPHQSPSSSSASSGAPAGDAQTAPAAAEASGGEAHADAASGGAARSLDNVTVLGAGSMSFGPAQVPMGAQFIDEGSMQPREGGSSAGGASTTGVDVQPLASGGGAAGAAASAPASGFTIGSSNFVPNNDFGLFGSFTGGLSGDIARFYDVTLAAEGRTTVDMNVEIDRLRLTGGNAAFELQSPYIFSTLIAFDQSGGVSQIDGLLLAREVMMTGGLMHGSGTISTMTFWNVAGMVSAGELNAIGQLDILGDYVQTDAGAVMFDWTPTASDLIFVDGDVALDGAAGINPLYLPQWGDRRTVMEYTGDLAGGFDGFIDLPGALSLSAIYGAGSIDLEIVAESFLDQATFQNPSQAGWAAFLDGARSAGYSEYEALYAQIDLQSGQNLLNAFDNLTPHEAFQFRRTTKAHDGAFATTLRRYLLEGGTAGGDGSTAAMFGLLGSNDGRQMSGERLSMMAQDPDTAPVTRQLGDGLELFFAGGVINGEFRSTQSILQNGDLEGAFGMAGLSAYVNDCLRLGGAIGFANTDTEQRLHGAGAQASGETDTVSITGYADYSPGNWVSYLSVSWAEHNISTVRAAPAGAAVLNIQGDQDASTLQAEALVGYDFQAGPIRFTPLGSLTWGETEYDAVSQSGGPLALNIGENIEGHLIGRVGAQFATAGTIGGVTLEPRLYVGVAHDYRDSDDLFYAGVSGLPGLVQLDSGIALEDDWMEFSGEILARMGNGLAASLGVDRRDGEVYGVDSTTVSAAVRYRF